MADEPAGGWFVGDRSREGNLLPNYGEAMETAEGRSSTVWTTKRKRPGRGQHPQVPGMDLAISIRYVRTWIADLKEPEKKGDMPALQAPWLPTNSQLGRRPPASRRPRA